MSCPHIHGESTQMQIYPYVPHPCVLYTYLYLVVTVDCTSRSGHGLYRYQLTRTVQLSKWLQHSSKHSNRMPGLANNYQVPSIQLCTQNHPSNVQIGQMNTLLASELLPSSNLELKICNYFLFKRFSTLSHVRK